MILRLKLALPFAFALATGCSKSDGGDAPAKAPIADAPAPSATSPTASATSPAAPATSPAAPATSPAAPATSPAASETSPAASETFTTVAIPAVPGPIVPVALPEPAQPDVVQPDVVQPEPGASDPAPALPAELVTMKLMTFQPTGAGAVSEEAIDTSVLPEATRSCIKLAQGALRSATNSAAFTAAVTDGLTSDVLLWVNDYSAAGERAPDSDGREEYFWHSRNSNPTADKPFDFSTGVWNFEVTLAGGLCRLPTEEQTKAHLEAAKAAHLAEEALGMHTLNINGLSVSSAEYWPFVEGQPVPFRGDDFPDLRLWGFLAAGSTPAAQACAETAWRELKSFMRANTVEMQRVVELGATNRFFLWTNDYSLDLTTHLNERKPAMWHWPEDDFANGFWKWESTLTHDGRCLRPSERSRKAPLLRAISMLEAAARN